MFEQMRFPRLANNRDQEPVAANAELDVIGQLTIGPDMDDGWTCTKYAGIEFSKLIIEFRLGADQTAPGPNCPVLKRSLPQVPRSS